MLFKQDQISDLSGVFNGWGSTINSDYDWQKWESKLPSLQTVNFFQLDPAYESKFGLGDVGESIVRELGIYSITSAMRNCMTRIATAWGWFQNALGAIKTVFKERIDTIANALETVQEVMSNISIAVNSISWIPIFGWIVKIIFEIAKIITKIIAAVKKAQEKRDKKALSENAKAFALPMAKWDPDIDTMMCQYMQRQLSAGVFDLEWCFMPRYPAKNASDFVAQHQKYNDDDECFSGWLIWSNQFKNKDPNVEPPGLGFVPGTMNIHAAVTLMTRAGGDVRDMGDFFPISRSLAANLWGQTVKGDSGMTFAIDTDKCINAWTDYISSAYGYGLDGIRGWSMIAGQINKSTPLSYTNARGPIEYKCSSCDHGAKGCTAGRDKGRWRTPAGKGHRDSYLAHLHQMFGWGEYGRQDDWWETATPVIALRNLRDRQEAMIRSKKCMYLDDSTNADGSGQPRFRAIKKGSSLHKLWDQCVTAMFESGDWKTIDYRDVIQGEEVDKALRLHLSNRYNTTPEKFFNLDKTLGSAIAGRASLGIAAKAGPSVLGDPKPPEPPAPVQVRTATVGGIPTSPKRAGMEDKVSYSKKKSSAAPMLIGAAAIGLLLMGGKK